MSSETARGGHPWHETDTQKYSNLKYGISLRYPKNYKIKEGDISATELGFMGTVEPKFTSPGSSRIMTVIMPSDLYPDTNYGAALVTASIHPKLSQSRCLDFGNTLARKRIARTVSGIRFHVLKEIEGSAGGKLVQSNYYHGYSSGFCYEIDLIFATGPSGIIEGRRILRASDQSVFADLNRILDSVILSRPIPDKKR